MDMNIIVDHLSKYMPKLVINRPDELDIELNFDCSIDTDWCSDYTLQIITVDQLCARFDALKDYPLLILGEVDDTLLNLLNANAIVIPDRSIELSVIQNDLYDLQWFYNDWLERLLDAVITGQPVNALMEIAEEVFENPIFLEDMESRLLGEVDLGTIQASEDRFLYQLYVKGFVDTEDFINFSSLSEENNLYVNPDLTPSFLDSPKTKYRLLVTYLSSNGQRFAAFQIVESKRKITPGQIVYARLFSEILEKYFNRTNWLAEDRDSAGRLLSNLIEGSFVAEQELTQFLSDLEWDVKDEFLVTAMTWTDSQYDTPYTKQRLIFDFRICFPYAAVYSDQQRFFLVLDCSKQFSYQQYLNDLKDLADRNRLYVGVSQQFTDLLHFRKYYQQSLYALNKAIVKDRQSVVEYQSCIPQVLYEFLQTAQVCAGDTIPYQLILLDNLDDAPSNQYVETLLAFIICGFNKSLTASKLQIHRNTLTYRLEKIESVLGIVLSAEQFSDADMMTYLISCYLLMVQRTNKK